MGGDHGIQIGIDFLDRAIALVEECSRRAERCTCARRVDLGALAGAT
jgi:hypothetical protein